MSEQIILTIAILTYNRLPKLKKTLETFMEYLGDDIEVLISDDSRDDSVLRYTENLDSRIRAYKREEDWKRTCYYTILRKARGRYVMILLDKDTLSPGCLEGFTDFLRNHPDIYYGRCLLPIDEDRNRRGYQIYEKGYAGIEAFAYKTFHPSGWFFLREYGKPFAKDCHGRSSLPGSWFADLALLGRGVLYRSPLIITETREECAKEKSHSFHREQFEKTLYGPEAAWKEFCIKTMHAGNLPLPESQRIQLLTTIFSTYLYQSTFGYREKKNDEQICAHYGVKKENVGYIKILIFGFGFYLHSIQFYRNHFPAKDHSELRRQIRRIFWRDGYLWTRGNQAKWRR